MGNVAPGKGEVHRMTVELRGPVSQGKYVRYKAAVAKIARKFGARPKKGKKFRVRK